MYTAIYLPARPEGFEDPSRCGFKTEDEAEAYVVTQMCSGCQEERKQAQAGGHEHGFEEEWTPSLYPGCFCEWVIGLTEKINAAGDFDQLMVAVGWEAVYHKDNTPEENEKLQAEFDKKASK
jgi:hypothetical protein